MVAPTTGAYRSQASRSGTLGTSAAEGDPRARGGVTRASVAGLLVAVTAGAAALRFWDISADGLGSLFYASAVRSMGLSWSNFVYAAFDPAGTITVDKPPLGLWLQVLSTKALGFEGLALRLPTALAGVAAVPLTFAAARPALGARGALLAAAVLAVFPEAVATARDTTMDAVVLAMLAGGAWLLVTAVEGRSTRLLLLWAAWMGLVFNVKMFEGFVVLSAALLYLGVRWRGEWRARTPALALATVLGGLVALSWVIAVDLTLADSRPRVMNSRSNSALDLALRYNGLERVLPGEVIVFEPLPGASPAAVARTQAAARRFGVGEAGPLRLVTGATGLLLGSTAILAAAGGLPIVVRGRAYLDGPRLFWLAWCVTGLVLFSFSNRAAVHYTESYAPALAVLAAAGLCEAFRLRAGWRALVLPAVVSLVAIHAWVVVSAFPPLRDRVTMASALTLALAGVAVIVVLLSRWLPRTLPTPVRLLTVGGSLAVPLTLSMWIAVESPREARAVTLPNPLVYASTVPPDPTQRLPLDVLLALPAPSEARYRFAIDGILRAGEAIALSGASVLPIWNEFLREPVLSPGELAALLAAGEVPWVVLSRQPSDSSLLVPLKRDIEAHCTPASGRGLGPAWVLYRCGPGIP